MDLLPDVWRGELWLPPGVTWADMERLADSERPLPRDLLLALPLSLGFVALRFLFESISWASGCSSGSGTVGVIVLSILSLALRFVAPPIGRCLGVRNRTQARAAPSPQMESFYTQRSRHPTQSEIVSLMSLCGRSQRQIEAWFRCRRNQDRPCQTKRFAEASWRFFFYLTSFAFGLACLVDAPWFWNLRECWAQYPVQVMQRAHCCYYMLELGFYLSLLLRISVDVRRKDFREQVIHHLATITLLSFSYCANYIRIGTLVMLLHDSSDILLESAKMFNYGTGWKSTSDGLFVVFAALFLVTRLIIFPRKIIHTTLVLSMESFEPFAGYYFFNAMLMVLQALHVFWAWLILRMVYKFLKGNLEGDERSDEESQVEEEEGHKEGEDDVDQDFCWEKSPLNSKLSMLSSSCVLNNLANHRASLAKKMRKAQ